MSNKPDWTEAPEWAEWMASDVDGGWWWYQNKPVFDSDAWICESMHVGKIEHARDADLCNHAEATLEPRP